VAFRCCGFASGPRPDEPRLLNGLSFRSTRVAIDTYQKLDSLLSVTSREDICFEEFIQVGEVVLS